MHRPKEKQFTPEALLGSANLGWSPKPGGKDSGGPPSVKPPSWCFLHKLHIIILPPFSRCDN